MERNKVKPDMVYAIQTAVAPGAQTPSSVPYIVNSTTVDLVDVINRAIAKGYVTDLKPEAINGLADAICEGTWDELSQGRGVKFGDLLRMQLFIDGTCDAAGNLTAENKLNVRFANGSEFKLDVGDFSWRYAGSGENPVINRVHPYGAEGKQESGSAGYIILGATAFISGSRLTKPGAMTSVICLDGPDGESVAEVDTFLNKSVDYLKFEVPADFVEHPGNDYWFVVERVEVSPSGESKIYRSVARRFKTIAAS